MDNATSSNDYGEQQKNEASLDYQSQKVYHTFFNHITPSGPDPILASRNILLCRVTYSVTSFSSICAI